MLSLDFHRSGRHFLQIPGPSPVPNRLLRAMSLPTIDRRGPEFETLGLKVLSGIAKIFKTRHPVVIYPASGTGAWEAALANTLSPGDHVLMYETGYFAALWVKMTARLGLSAEFLAWSGKDEHLPDAPHWRRGVQPDLIESVYSPVLTGVIMPAGVDADAVRRLTYQRFDLSLGTGLGRLKGRMFRIGHLGDSNDLTLLGALAGVEMGLRLSNVRLAGSGLQAAMDKFAASSDR
jgi:aspartate aminotransferase-like enzyme